MFPCRRYNGLVYGGVEDEGAYELFEFNHVHGNGHESDDGICDFGAIHGSNPGPSRARSASRSLRFLHS